MKTVNKLKNEIVHAKGIGEYEYAEDLQFIVNFIEGKLKYSFIDDNAITCVQDAADYIGINLTPFQE